MGKRVFIIVCDSLGIGKAPDALSFGDGGTDTLRAIISSDCFRAPVLESLGLFNIDGIDYGDPSGHPLASYARAEEASMGKDSTIGHWEIAGLITERPLPVFPDGFAEKLVRKIEEIIGRRLVCNMPYSGTKALSDFGEHHLMTGDLIAYTSADSVFQIAAHESIVPPEELYEICRTVRNVLDGDPDTAVGRVIARPFSGKDASEFTRTANRHDFSIAPPRRTMLDFISDSGLDTISIGKIWDLFAGKGIGKAVHTAGNDEGMSAALEEANSDFSGLCFVNLVDFDTVYGHRRDIEGYARAVSEFDSRLAGLLDLMREDDILIITADHGCDPSYSLTTDHTRECVPILIYSRKLSPKNIGTLHTFADIGCTVCDYLGVAYELDGSSFLDTLQG
ncbi:MAG: phosphopentomutase [Oscillospiraceae bacterium]|nr:phosphopentomutase [Oscillospiraceae bacterium]